MDKKIKQLCYISYLRDGLDSAEVIKEIEDIAKNKNKKHAVTGRLIYSNEIFIQVLEGNALNVDLTYRIIEEDHRHENPFVIFDQENEVRCYPDWSMKFESLGSISLQKINNVLEIANKAKKLDHLTNNQIDELFNDFIEASK